LKDLRRVAGAVAPSERIESPELADICSIVSASTQDHAAVLG
jgi:hypothetical protein